MVLGKTPGEEKKNPIPEYVLILIKMNHCLFQSNQVTIPNGNVPYWELSAGLC